jgi:hypothetical protein
MKKIAILLLAIVLVACSSPATPTEQPTAAVAVEPSATPVVVVQTVVVAASPAPTDVPPPTAVPPTAVPPTAVAPVVVTVVVQPTQAAPAQSAATQASGNAPIALDNALGKGVFTNMTISSNAFTLRCSPRDITFNVTTANTDIKDVVFYYRTSDLKRLYPKELTAFGKMTANGNGNFTLTFTGENINPDYRLDGSLFDFQFVGLNKGGGRVDSSQIINDLVKFTFDCP